MVAVPRRIAQQPIVAWRQAQEATQSMAVVVEAELAALATLTRQAEQAFSAARVARVATARPAALWALPALPGAAVEAAAWS